MIIQNLLSTHYLPTYMGVSVPWLKRLVTPPKLFIHYAYMARPGHLSIYARGLPRTTAKGKILSPKIVSCCKV